MNLRQTTLTSANEIKISRVLTNKMKLMRRINTTGRGLVIVGIIEWDMSMGEHGPKLMIPVLSFNTVSLWAIGS
jgi:hypothetical protein